jgi:hypothetical protein
VLWSRPRSLTADVLHFHHKGISYGAPSSATVDVRIHLAIRVLNDDFASVALNGPSSRDYLAHRPGYHLSFTARSFSQYDRCLLDAVRFLVYFRQACMNPSGRPGTLWPHGDAQEPCVPGGLAGAGHAGTPDRRLALGLLGAAGPDAGAAVA